MTILALAALAVLALALAARPWRRRKPRYVTAQHDDGGPQ